MNGVGGTDVASQSMSTTTGVNRDAGLKVTSADDTAKCCYGQKCCYAQNCCWFYALETVLSIKQSFSSHRESAQAARLALRALAGHYTCCSIENREASLTKPRAPVGLEVCSPDNSLN